MKNRARPESHMKVQKKSFRKSVSGKKSFRWAGLLFMCLILFYFGRPIALANEIVAREHIIKTGFLYNFAKFIEWPPLVFPSASSDLNICLIGADPFGDSIESINGKTVGSHPVRVRRIKSVEEIERSDDCHILFIGLSDKDEIAEVLQKIRKKPILTVGDQESAAESGVAITMVVLEEKVRFQINNKAALEAGIKISSKLLRLAIRIVE
jgi:hypothetical protein